MRNLVALRNFNDPFSLLDEFERGFSIKSSEFSPKVEVSDKGSHYLYSFDVPGVNKEDLHIEVKDSFLKLSGERKYEKNESDYSEKVYGKFERVLSLPKGIRGDEVEAHYDNGVLSVALAKQEEVQPKKVEISNNKKDGIWSRLLS